MEPGINDYTPKKERLLATDHMFEEFILGNMLLPQTGFGVVTFLGRAVLEDPSVKLDSLTEIELASEQVDYVSKLMSNSHAARGINTLHKSHTALRDKSALYGTPRQLGNINVMLVWQTGLSIIEQQLQTISQFNHSLPHELLLQFDQICAGFIESDAGKKLANLYKRGFIRIPESAEEGNMYNYRQLRANMAYKEIISRCYERCKDTPQLQDQNLLFELFNHTDSNTGLIITQLQKREP